MVDTTSLGNGRSLRTAAVLSAVSIVLASCWALPNESLESQTTIGPGNPAVPAETIPVDAVTDSSFHWSPDLCQLNVSMRRGLVAVEGTLVGMDGPYVRPSPGEGLPDREYWLVTVNVERVLDGSTFEADLGVLGAAARMPPAHVGSELTLVEYTDGGAVETLQAAVESKGRGVALLTPGFHGTEEAPEFVWGLRRFGQVEEGKAVFHGDCGDVLSTQFSGLAQALDRPVDLELLSDLVSELIVNRDSLGMVGPLESAIPLG
jgi:hypothetical protein